MSNEDIYENKSKTVNSDNFSITLIPIAELKIHENIVRRRVEQLKQSIKESGKFTLPILVSTERIILDGHHRYQALKELGAKYAPCVVIDYRNNDDVKLSTWFPVGDTLEPKQFSELVRFFRKTLHQLPDGSVKIEDLTEAQLNNTLTKLQLQGLLVLFDATQNKKEKIIMFGIKEDLNTFLQKIEAMCCQLHFVPTANEALDLARKSQTFVILRKILTKEEVINSALKGTPLPPKTTRHIYPFKLYTIDVELSQLFNHHNSQNSGRSLSNGFEN